MVFIHNHISIRRRDGFQQNGFMSSLFHYSPLFSLTQLHIDYFFFVALLCSTRWISVIERRKALNTLNTRLTNRKSRLSRERMGTLF